jgi:hypothetical protein
MDYIASYADPSRLLDLVGGDPEYGTTIYSARRD